MTKFKKVFLTIASALCCVTCLTLAILGLFPKKTVVADTSNGYETATVYDVSQLSSSGPSATTGDVAWLEGKTLAVNGYAFDFSGKGYAAATVDSAFALKSVGITFQMKVEQAWTATNNNAFRLFFGYTEVRWNYNATSGLKLEVFDWNGTTGKSAVGNSATRVSETDAYIDNFNPTEFTTYKIVRSVAKDDATSYKLDIYMNGTHEYTAMFNSMVLTDYKNWVQDRVRFYVNNNTANGVQNYGMTVKSAFIPAEAEVKDIYDYSEKDEYLKGKALTSTNNYAFDLSDKGYGEEENFGISFNLKLNNNKTRNEVFRFRTANFDVRLRLATATDSAWFNVYDYTNNTYTAISAKVIFAIDEDVAHNYTFKRQKLDVGGKVSYLYTLAVDGDVKEQIISNFAIAKNTSESNSYGRFVLTLETANCDDATFRSAKYYGVKVDGVMNKVSNGEKFPLNYEGENLFFGFTDGETVYENGTQIGEYKEIETLTMNVTNEAGAYIRFLHAGTASLKWVTHINKADLAKLQAVYGEENVVFERLVTADWDTDTEIRNVVPVSAMADLGEEYSFSQILSNIKQSNFDKKFNYTTVVSVQKDGEVLFRYEVENDNSRSIQEIAQKAYDDVKTESELNALSAEVKALYQYTVTVTVEGTPVTKYSRLDVTQRQILEQYLATVTE